MWKREKKEISDGGSPKGVRTPFHDTFNLINSVLPIGKQMAGSPAEMNEHFREELGGKTYGLTDYWDGIKNVQRLMDKLPKVDSKREANSPHELNKQFLLKGGNAVRSSISKQAKSKSITAISESRTYGTTRASENKVPAFLRILGKKKVPLSENYISRDEGFGLGALKLQVPTNIPISNVWLNRKIKRLAVRNAFTYPQNNARTRKKELPTNKKGFFQYGINEQPQITVGKSNKELSNFNFYTRKKSTAYRFADEFIKPIAHNVRADNSGLARWFRADRAVSKSSLASTEGKQNLVKVKGRGY